MRGIHECSNAGVGVSFSGEGAHSSLLLQSGITIGIDISRTYDSAMHSASNQAHGCGLGFVVDSIAKKGDDVPLGIHRRIHLRSPMTDGVCRLWYPHEAVTDPVA